MRTILRYELPDCLNRISIAAGAKVLSVGVSVNALGKEIPSIWAECDVHDDVKYEPYGTEIRTFFIAGTGSNIDDISAYDKTYLGTMRLANQYAYHIYEVTTL